MKKISPRQREILDLVAQKGSISVEQIHEAVGISQATAYREIQALVSMGLTARIPGGIGQVETQKSSCIQCGQENNPRTTMLIEQTNGEKLSACCPHCGLMALSSRTNIRTAMTPDFLNGTMLNVRTAWYVLNSEISLCCQPSVLSFSQRNDAERFMKGFTGEIADFSDAQRIIQQMMEF